ncbi:MAG: hypothetical protein LC790_21120, partial [Actinobacteria bacterium]|nr:hypothetical protein [Actinomycetota bacterium]
LTGTPGHALALWPLHRALPPAPLVRANRRLAHAIGGDLAGGRAQPFALTDLGNAERFAAEHGRRFRYVHEWGRWILWHDSRWRDDAIGEATRAAKSTARGLLAEAAAIENPDARSRPAKWGAVSQAEPRIRAMLTLATTELEVAVSAAQLDRHPYMLACANGGPQTPRRTWLTAAEWPATRPRRRRSRRLAQRCARVSGRRGR